MTQIVVFVLVFLNGITILCELSSFTPTHCDFKFSSHFTNNETGFFFFITEISDGNPFHDFFYTNSLQFHHMSGFH